MTKHYLHSPAVFLAAQKPEAPEKTSRQLTSLALRASVLAVCAMTLLSDGSADERRHRPTWTVGAELQRLRQQPIKLSWSGVPIRDGLGDLSAAQRVAILLDRRIDAERPIDLGADRTPLDDLLGQIALAVDGGAAWLGPLAYIGPRPAAARLRTLAALRAGDARALPKDEQPTFLREATWHWTALAEPRNLVAELAAQANVAIEPLALISHDLWPAADLPALTWTDRLTLVANEFDLTFEFVDGSHVRLVPVQGPVVIERDYPGGKEPDKLARRWRELAPDAQVSIARGKLVVRGRLEDHELLTQKKPLPQAHGKGGADVYTMTVREQPLAAVLERLRQQVPIDLRVDEAALHKAKLSLDRRVTFSVVQASLEELLAAALQAADLSFVREGNAYTIVPAKVADE